VVHIVYEFDLVPDIYGLDWIGSAKMDPCPTLATDNWHLPLKHVWTFVRRPCSDFCHGAL